MVKFLLSNSRPENCQANFTAHPVTESCLSLGHSLPQKLDPIPEQSLKVYFTDQSKIRNSSFLKKLYLGSDAVSDTLARAPQWKVARAFINPGYLLWHEARVCAEQVPVIRGRTCLPRLLLGSQCALHLRPCWPRRGHRSRALPPSAGRGGPGCRRAGGRSCFRCASACRWLPPAPRLLLADGFISKWHVYPFQHGQTKVQRKPCVWTNFHKLKVSF